MVPTSPEPEPSLEEIAILAGWESEISDEPPPSGGWRRLAIPAVAVVTAIALLMIPVYNLIDSDPPKADNGLEVCGFDYCLVQEAVRAAGLDLEMSRLANTFVSDLEAEELARSLALGANMEPPDFVVVDRLEGQVKGVYEPSTRTIYVERPIRAWIVIHEVAHVVAAGHGEEFQRALLGLILMMGQTGA